MKLYFTNQEGGFFVALLTGEELAAVECGVRRTYGEGSESVYQYLSFGPGNRPAAELTTVEVVTPFATGRPLPKDEP